MKSILLILLSLSLFYNGCTQDSLIAEAKVNAVHQILESINQKFTLNYKNSNTYLVVDFQYNDISIGNSIIGYHTEVSKIKFDSLFFKMLLADLNFNINKGSTLKSFNRNNIQHRYETISLTLL